MRGLTSTPLKLDEKGAGDAAEQEEEAEPEEDDSKETAVLPLGGVGVRGLTSTTLRLDEQEAGDAAKEEGVEAPAGSARAPTEEVMPSGGDADLERGATGISETFKDDEADKEEDG